MREIKARGFILKCTNYGESDKIVTFFSKELGKTKGIAKGARRSLKRFGGCLEQFSLIEMVVTPREGLSLFMEGKVARNYKSIKGDLDKIFFGSYLLDVVNSLLNDGYDDRSSEIYNLLLSAMETMENNSHCEEAVREFEVRFLSVIGYMPSFLICISCNASVESHKYEKKETSNIAFSASKGGVYCSSCSHQINEKIEYISLGTLKTLDKASSKKVSFTRNALDESSRIIPDFISYHLGRRLKSLEFLEKVGISK